MPVLRSVKNGNSEGYGTSCLSQSGIWSFQKHLCPGLPLSPDQTDVHYRLRLPHHLANVIFKGKLLGTAPRESRMKGDEGADHLFANPNNQFTFIRPLTYHGSGRRMNFIHLPSALCGDGHHQSGREQTSIHWVKASASVA